MKQVTGLTSTYSSDTFGVCSALYELGGMVVMHDASGCNSTYTTHDEPRWYSMESMIFISALSEKEAVMGDDEKLIRDVTETAAKLRPNFIALAGAPIPFMTGTDFRAIAALIERRTGIPTFGFDTNGMQGYLTGISMALTAVVKRFCRRNEDGAGRNTPGESARNPLRGATENETEVDCNTSGESAKGPSSGLLKNLSGCKTDKDKNVRVNIIGVTPLDFSLNGSVESMNEWLAESGFTAGVCLAMGNSLEDLADAGRADVNLVVSYGGLAAARELKKQFGTPWVAGVPVGKVFAAELAEKVKAAAQTKRSAVGYIEGLTVAVQSSDKGFSIIQKERSDKSECGKKEIFFIGESIFGGSLARAIELETGSPVRVFCPVETKDFLLRDGDFRTPEEDDLLRELSSASTVIADPLYQRICPPETDFRPLRHVAFSGRLFADKDFNLINKVIWEKMTC